MTLRPKATLVFGLAVAGRAVASALRERGEDVLVADDHLDADHKSFAHMIGAQVVDCSNADKLALIMSEVDIVAPAPGVPEHHPVISAARNGGVPIYSEIELAYQLEQQRAIGARPMVAVTGTDGKTTATLMANEMLRAAGYLSEAVGNTEVPLIESLGTSANAFAIECSSFRLEYTEQFRVPASAWLNIAPDHLDWHSSYERYFAAKAKLWAHCLSTDVAVAPVDDPLICNVAQNSNARVVTFGLNSGDYHMKHGELVGPQGTFMTVSKMGRALPHDITNALAAAAMCIEAGWCSTDHVARALATFEHAPHRIQFVRELNGVRWFNDSKATSPHAVSVALASFDSVVLIAGGKNKGLDLGAMAGYPQRMRGVVAIGAAASEIAQAFAGVCTVVMADSMESAVTQAQTLAHSGDVVLLSPGCTSYDWYSNYGERGDVFMNYVKQLSEQHL